MGGEYDEPPHHGVCSLRVLFETEDDFVKKNIMRSHRIGNCS